ncbi:MAG: flippase-like domain-containing protein [candidate division Zixibacteria bacterium]|nr:flippase-like domain-containing protein [candidate division Zixibacteria bacterium]
MTDVIEDQKIDVKSRFLRFNTLLAFIAAAIVIYIFLTRFDFSQVLDIIGKSNFLFYFFAFAVFYGFLPLRGHRWRKLLLESEINLPTSELSRIFYQAFFVNSILPARIGDIYRAYLLKKRRKISMSLSIGVLFSERIFDLASIALLVLLGGIFYLDKVASPEIRGYITTGLTAFGVIVILFIIFSWRANLVDRFLPEKFRKYYESFKKGLFKSPKRIPAILLESFIIWLSEAARLYFVAWALGCQMDFLMAIFISQAALIIMTLPLTPAGLGLVELLMFAVLIPAGFSKEQAAAIVIADRLISYWLLIIFGAVHYIFSPRYR